MCVFLDEAYMSYTSLQSISESDVSESSVIIKWNHMENKPTSNLHQYYSYYVQYKQTVDSDWTTGRIVPYNADDDPPKVTLDGLTAGTEYEARVLGIRELNGKTDLLDNTSSSNIRTFSTGTT